MSVLNTVKELFEASAEPSDRDDLEVMQSKGAYWCHDCDERVSAAMVEREETPTCSECGDEMAFEPSPPTTGCGC